MNWSSEWIEWKRWTEWKRTSLDWPWPVCGTNANPTKILLKCQFYFSSFIIICIMIDIHHCDRNRSQFSNVRIEWNSLEKLWCREKILARSSTTTNNNQYGRCVNGVLNAYSALWAPSHHVRMDVASECGRAGRSAHISNFEQCWTQIASVRAQKSNSLSRFNRIICVWMISNICLSRNNPCVTLAIIQPAHMHWPRPIRIEIWPCMQTPMDNFYPFACVRLRAAHCLLFLLIRNSNELQLHQPQHWLIKQN